MKLRWPLFLILFADVLGLPLLGYFLLSGSYDLVIGAVYLAIYMGYFQIPLCAIGCLLAGLANDRRLFRIYLAHALVIAILFMLAYCDLPPFVPKP